MILPVIMAGGMGSRLWPLSRAYHPKQFLHLHGQGTMLQNTVSRLDGLPVSAPLVICGEQHRFLVADQFRQPGHPPVSILCEPVARSTAPAVALAALQCVADECDPVLLVLAADHVIEDEAAFRLAVQCALPLALQGKLVTFGIVPTGPETGYGYIERGEAVSQQADVFSVARFVEKPDRSRAQAFIDSGRYYWNSGMFMFRATRYLEELKRFRPDILLACQQATERAGSAGSPDFIPVDRISFTGCPAESIDYAVMEKTADAVVAPLDAGWSDVGAWDAVWKMADKDCNNNAVSGDVVMEGASGCYVRGQGRRIAVVGVDDLVIVDTPDAVLIARKQCAQQVKAMSDYPDRCTGYLRDDKTEGARSGIKENFTLSRVTLQTGERITRQVRAGYMQCCLVLSGEAKITTEDRVCFLVTSQSTAISGGKICIAENTRQQPLEMLEIVFVSNRSDGD